MSTKSAVFTVTAAVRIDSTPDEDRPSGQSIIAYNNGAAVCYLGSSAVDASVGIPVAAATSLSLVLGANDQLWAFCATTTELRVLEVGVSA